MAATRFIDLAITVVLAAALGACNQSNFSGSGKPAEAKPQPQVADAEPNSDLGTTGESKPSKKKPKNDDDDLDDDEGSVKPTDNPTVVTAGSFSAWAEPSAPALRQDYYIIIEVKLPQNVGNYTLADLNGELSGTDSYRQSISTTPQAWNSYDPPMPIPLPEFVLSGRVARLKIRVPGAHVPLTKDTVTIRSTLLNEQQTLGIQFQ